MSFVKLTVDSNNGVARLTLNRPEKLNAFSRALCDEYLARLNELRSLHRSKKITAVFVCAEGTKAFCAGADLGERAKMTEDQIDEQLKIQRSMMDGTAALDVPTFAVIGGVAFGGGLELALSCDFRLATPGAWLGLTETKLAIIPGSGGTQRLTRLIGEAKAKEMILLGKKLSATEAFTIGLVTEVCDDLEAGITKYAQMILDAGPLALEAAKLSISKALDLNLHDGLDFERSCYERVLKSEDRKEGLRAFLEKRKPSYQAQ